MGLVFIKHTCLTCRVTKKPKEKKVGRILIKTLICFIVFMGAYIGSKHSGRKMMDIIETLQSNDTVTPMDYPPYHNEEDRNLE